jgi:hypothetical protein
MGMGSILYRGRETHGHGQHIRGGRPNSTECLSICRIGPGYLKPILQNAFQSVESGRGTSICRIGPWSPSDITRAPEVTPDLPRGPGDLNPALELQIQPWSSKSQPCNSKSSPGPPNPALDLQFQPWTSKSSPEGPRTSKSSPGPPNPNLDL